MIPRAKLSEIAEADLQRLIDHGTREGRTLDFKEAAALAKDNRQALAEDVCAFANTVGGDLVIGVQPVGRREGDSAMAKAFDSVRVSNLDETLLELVNSMRDALEPQLATLQVQPVPLAAGGHVIVLRVGASPSAPHRVVRERGGHFFLRNSTGKERMDIHAIRTAFAFADGLAERVRQFRDARLAALRERRGPVPVPPGPLLAVHLIPLTALTRPERYSIEALKMAGEALLRAEPAENTLRSPKPSVEGVICVSRPDPQRQHEAYAQLFRNGCIELVAALAGDQRGEARPILYPPRHEKPLVKTDLPAALEALARLDIPAPVYLSVSLLNVAGLRVSLGVRMPPDDMPTVPAHASDLPSELVYLEDLGVAPAVLAAPALDVLWNAIGEEHTRTSFDKEDR
jgi:hypothetical protein